MDAEVTEPIAGDPTAADSFPLQWEYVTSSSIRNAVLCGRRAGKTAGILLRTRKLFVAGKRIIYIARVRRNAREQAFLPFKDALSRFAVPYKTQEADMIVRGVIGEGCLICTSVDDISDIEKIRGFKFDLAIVDEAQSFKDDVLEPLIDLILIPTLIDGGGALDLVGTPPDALDGYFVKALGSQGWTQFGWSIFHNPHIPAENVHNAYLARNIGPGHNVWEREVEGKLVMNAAARVYPFDQDRNTFAWLPGEDDEHRPK